MHRSLTRLPGAWSCPCYCMLMEDQEECEACELIELHKIAVHFALRLSMTSKAKDKGVLVNTLMLWAKFNVKFYFHKVIASVCICQHWESSDLEVYDAPDSDNSDNSDSDNGSSIGDHDEGSYEGNTETLWQIPRYPHV